MGRREITGMKYFWIFVDEHYVAPAPKDWYGKLDPKTLQGKHSYDMPKHLIFLAEKHMQMVFTDVITFPCFMVSKMVRDVLLKYDSTLKFARIVLYSKERKRSMAYYLPFLKQEKPLKLVKENGGIKIFMEREKIAGKIILETKGAARTYVVIRMDALERILMRGEIGIGPREIYITDGGE